MLRIMWVFCSEMKMLQVLAEGLQGRDEIRRKKYSKKRDICELTGSSVWSPLLLLATRSTLDMLFALLFSVEIYPTFAKELSVCFSVAEVPV